MNALPEGDYFHIKKKNDSYRISERLKLNAATNRTNYYSGSYH